MNEKTTVSEYKIGHTTYVVKTTFNPVFKESLSDILKRMIIRDSKISSVKWDKNTKSKLYDFGISAY